jgi:SEC-C motif-containing protein
MTNNNITEHANCPCCSDKTYAECCEPLHDGVSHAVTAEQLMRSRYSAFALKLTDYVQQTWDTNTSPDTVTFDGDELQWQGLEIITTKKGKAGDNKGIVQFKATFTLDGKQQVVNEMSRFVKKSSRWLYLDGKVKSVVEPNQQTSQGKNAPCSCGSGKKYKRCCGQT